MPKYTIHVPHFKADNNGIPVTDAHEVVDMFVKQLAAVAGGCTVVTANAVGYWTSSRHGLVADHQTIVEVVCSGSLWHYDVLPLVSQLKKDLNQRSLFVLSANADFIPIP